MATLKHAFNAKDMNSLVYRIIEGKVKDILKLAVFNDWSKVNLLQLSKYLLAKVSNHWCWVDSWWLGPFCEEGWTGEGTFYFSVLTCKGGLTAPKHWLFENHYLVATALRGYWESLLRGLGCSEPRWNEPTLFECVAPLTVLTITHDRLRTAECVW